MNKDFKPLQRLVIKRTNVNKKELYEISQLQDLPNEPNEGEFLKSEKPDRKSIALDSKNVVE